MSLFRSSLRPPAIVSDEAIERYLAAIRSELAPDPLFRRRLRGHVVNRYVAAREGQATGRGQSKAMGRLGRAVLYASFALGLSVTGAMAGSQQAIPGDALYAVKLQIELLRLEVVPERLHDDLAAHSLGERIDELRRLSESGSPSAAHAHAAAVEAAYERVVVLSPDGATLAGHLEVAGALFERLPEQAQLAVAQALLDSPGRGQGLTTSDDGGAGDGRGRGADEGGPNPPDADQAGSPGHSPGVGRPTPRAEPHAVESPGTARSPRPTRSLKP